MTSPRRSIGVRVRPNAHDFIRDLAAELKTKKYTFYVDVGAKTTQATRDVRTWAKTSLQAVDAKVPISARLTQASLDVSAWRKKVSGMDTTIPVKADTSAAWREIARLRAAANDPITFRVRSDTKGVKAPSAASAPRRSTSNPDVLKVDVGAEQRQLKRTAKGLQEFLDSTRPKVDIDTRPAQMSMRDMIQKFNQTTVTVDAEVNTRPAKRDTEEFRAAEERKKIKQELDIDVKKAQLKLAELRIQEKMRKLEINVTTKKGSAERVFDTLHDIEKRMGSFSIIRSLDVGPFNLGRPTGLVGTLTTATALAGAFPALVAGASAASQALVQLAGAAAILPGALGGALASISTFAVGASGFGEAVGALFDVWNEGATEQAQTAKRGVQAQNNLVQATRREAQAQRQVGNARKQATNDLRNLNNELRGSVLNEAQAILDLQRARDRLNEGDFENQTDYLQARLDEAQAVDNLINVRERNVQLQDRVNTANQEGVEGSEIVQSALEAQAQAAEATAEALEAVNSSWALGAMGKFSDELMQLSPNAQAVVLTLASLKDQLFDLRGGLQDTMFANVAPALQSGFQALLPIIQPGMQAIAEGLNQNILQVFDTLQSADGQSIISRILGGTAEAQKALTGLIDPLVRGFGTLMAAGAEHLPQLVDLFTRLAERFATFIETADKDGSLDEFLDRGIAGLEDMIEIGINFIKIINDLNNAFGGNLLQSLVNVTNKWHEFLSSERGQAKLKEWIADAGELWEDWRPILEDLPGLFSAVADGAKVFIDVITPFLNLFTEMFERAPWLVQGFVAAWLSSKFISGFLSPAFTLTTGILKALRAFPGAMRAIPNIPFPGGPGILTTPGTTPPIAGPAPVPWWNTAARAGGSILGSAAIPITASVIVADQAMSNVDNSISREDSDRLIKEIEAQFPSDVEQAFGTRDSKNPKLRDAIKSWAKTNKAAEWVYGAKEGTAGFVDFAKRLNYFFSHPELHDDNSDAVKNFTPPPQYYKGGPAGYTNWPQHQGNLAVLHGKEYIQPADVTSYYGVDAMRAIHEKRVPPGLLRSFEGGGYNPPLYDQNGNPVSTQGVPANQQNPAVASNPGILGTLTHGVASLASHGVSQGINVASQVGGAVQGAGPAPGPTGMPMPFGAFGPAPGPAVTPAATSPGFNLPLFGMNIPIGGQQKGFNAEQFFSPGNWPFGVPGIGKPGTTAEEAGDWLANWGADTVMKFGDALLRGGLGFFGLEGILDSPYMNAGRTIGGHIGETFGSSGSSSGGSAETNAAVESLLNTYAGMPMNPAYPGVPGAMPMVFDASGSALPGGSSGRTGGEGGLQVKTIAIKRMIENLFPQIQTIGGYRQDALEWHPSGRALDVMIPTGDIRNNPAGEALGDAIYAWATGPQGQAMGVYPAGTLWKTMTGGNHFDHVHIALQDGGGYPSGTGPVGPTWGSGSPAQPWASPSGAPAPKPSPSAPAPKPTQVLPPSPTKTSTAENVYDLLVPKVRDKGGWLDPGYNLVYNGTGKPELTVPWDQLPSFAVGGLNNLPTGAVPPPPGFPRPPDAKQINPQPRPRPAAPRPATPSAPAPPQMAPQPTLPPVTPTAPPVATPPAQPDPGRQSGAVVVGGGAVAPNTQPGSESMDHVHPALKKGIASTASTLGNIAATAMQIGASVLGAAGGAGAGPSMGASAGASAGAAALGGLSGYVAGLFQQGGKIVDDVANVASSFLVGNITGGTTENAYGVTQRHNIPSGGTRVVDASSNHNGDIYTNNLDEYFALVRRRENQKAQSNLKQWSR